eukprot:TRINITY_DN3493_c0_g1_i1.p1 TRINITY_DN3493_c0_g1~~TRINITY_DN3493_c0_g1_i1.p1  ORF type:complete len:264 (+),score=-22.48 TRINITY_DN3493_c0_g1_i1:368-1159(+)
MNSVRVSTNKSVRTEFVQYSNRSSFFQIRTKIYIARNGFFAKVRIEFCTSLLKNKQMLFSLLHFPNTKTPKAILQVFVKTSKFESVQKTYTNKAKQNSADFDLYTHRCISIVLEILRKYLYLLSYYNLSIIINSQRFMYTLLLLLLLPIFVKQVFGLQSHSQKQILLRDQREGSEGMGKLEQGQQCKSQSLTLQYITHSLSCILFFTHFDKIVFTRDAKIKQMRTQYNLVYDCPCQSTSSLIKLKTHYKLVDISETRQHQNTK